MLYDPKLLEEHHRHVLGRAQRQVEAYLQYRDDNKVLFGIASEYFVEYQKKQADYEREHSLWLLWTALHFSSPLKKHLADIHKLFQPAFVGAYPDPEEALSDAATRVQKEERRILSHATWKDEYPWFVRAVAKLALGQSLPSYQWRRYREAYAEYAALGEKLRASIRIPFFSLPLTHVVWIVQRSLWPHLVGRATPFLLALKENRPELLPSAGETLIPDHHKIYAFKNGEIEALITLVRERFPECCALETPYGKAISESEISRHPIEFRPSEEPKKRSDEDLAPPSIFSLVHGTELYFMQQLDRFLATDKGELVGRLIRGSLLELPTTPPAMPEAVEEPKAIDDRAHWLTEEAGWRVWPWEEHYRYLRLSENPENILVGYNPETQLPVYVDRRILQGHGHILGRSRGGKTSAGLTALLVQLIRGTDELDSKDAANYLRPAPMVIFDFKGDMALFHTARIEAKARGQVFRHFTLHEDFDSYLFDPLADFTRLMRKPVSLGESLLQALSLVHGDEYGPRYYSGQSRGLLLGVLADLLGRGKTITFEAILRQLEKADRETRRDTNELVNLIKALLESPVGERIVATCDPNDERLISMHRVIENREVAYFWLPNDRFPMAARDVGKLAIFAFLQVAKERRRQGNARRSYCLIDEFQHVVSRNVGELFQTASGGNVSLVVANQSIKDLKILKVDISHILRDNTAYKQWFSVLDLDDIEYINKISGEHIVMLPSVGHSEEEGVTENQGWGRGTRHGESTSTATSSGSTWNYGEGGFVQYDRSGEQWTRSHGGSNSLSVSRGDTWDTSEQRTGGEARSSKTGRSLTLTPHIRPRVTSEDVREVCSRQLGSFIHVAEDKGETRLRGIPLAVQGLYLISEEEHNLRDAGSWPPLKAKEKASHRPERAQEQPAVVLPAPTSKHTDEEPKSMRNDSAPLLPFMSAPTARLVKDPELRPILRAEHGRKLQELFDREKALV